MTFISGVVSLSLSESHKSEFFSSAPADPDVFITDWFLIQRKRSPSHKRQTTLPRILCSESAWWVEKAGQHPSPVMSVLGTRFNVWTSSGP